MNILAQAASQAEPAWLMSLYKPIVFTFVVLGWAWVVSRLDKDADRFYLGRHIWNGIQISTGILAFFVWAVVVQFFWLGMFVTLVIFSASIGGYVMFRNTKLPKQHHWRLSADVFRDWWKQKETQKAQRYATTHLMQDNGAPIEVPSGEDLYSEAHVLFEQIMDFALPRAANRFEVAVNATQSNIGVRVDGVHYPQAAASPRLAISLIDYLKKHAGMDIADRRRKQRGHLLIETEDFGRHELSIASAGSTRGRNMIVQIDQQKAARMPLDKIGLLEVQRSQLEPLLGQKKYVVLAVCPPRHGLTSTLTSLVARHDPYTQSIMTLEDEVELEIEGVAHETIEPGSDIDTIERRLAAMLRSDPAVVMLNRLTDPSHARVIAEAAKTVRFYIGLNQADTFTALRIWLKAVNDMEMGAVALGAIIAQRLVRKLCPTCRVAYKPNPEVLKKLNLSADRVPQLYKHSGKVNVGRDRTETCSNCFGMGFRGRIGVFEVLVLDDEARRILATSQLDQFRAHVRRQKMLYLQETALLKVVKGLTSIKEITRALSGST